VGAGAPGSIDTTNETGGIVDHCLTSSDGTGKLFLILAPAGCGWGHLFLRPGNDPLCGSTNKPLPDRAMEIGRTRPLTSQAHPPLFYPIGVRHHHAPLLMAQAPPSARNLNLSSPPSPGTTRS